MIDNSTSITWSGTKGTVTGSVKYIENYGSPYDVGQQSGHFFPIKFANKYLNKVITVGSQNGEGGKDITPTSTDPYLIIRLENVTVGNKISAIVQETKEEVFELDFSSVTRNECPVGEIAFNKDKTDYGGFGKNSDYYKDGSIKIAWNDTTATVTGELNYLKRDAGNTPKLSEDGNYFAFSLNEWFKNKQITVTNSKDKTAQETDWVCTITESNKIITVKYENTLIAKFDLSKIVLGKSV